MLVATFECTRCHELPGIAPAAPEKQCFGCHQRIHAGTFTPKHISVAVWQQRITSLRYAPSLVAADRLRRVWVQQFLLHPHDLRPGSVAEMPRLAITADQAARLATFLVPREDAMPIDTSDELVARGERLFRTYACGRCHRFTGSAVDDPSLHAAAKPAAKPDNRTMGASRGSAEPDNRTVREVRGSAEPDNRTTPNDAASSRGSSRNDAARAPQPSSSGGAAPVRTDVLTARSNVRSNERDQGYPHALEAWTLAPDLRFARERMQPTQLVAWIHEPRGAMPNLAIDEADARALAAFIIATPLVASASGSTASGAPRRLPILDRPVSWAEVSKQVFHDQCWHCHAVADYARGDGGPGNTGGFGFSPRGLDLSSYEGISQGVIGDDGERHSVFEQLADGTPRIVAHMMARYVEEAGGSLSIAGESVRGMPLGLPPLSLEKIQLVETWIAQGRPQ